MTVTKAVVQGILIASLTGSSAQAGSMLVLGMTSSDSTPTTSMTRPMPALPFGFGTAPSAGLRLGLTNAASVANFPAATQPTAPAFVQRIVAESTPAPAPAAFPTPVSATWSSDRPSAGPFDAFVNLGSGPYANAHSLTTGSPQPWYQGNSVARVFGGVPDARERADFDATVLQRVRQTFGLSGVPVSLTDRPTDSAAHTLSVVSGTTNPTMRNALGMTYIGGNGFHYIDNAANVAGSVDQLEWIVAHNLAHELMLAFKVPEVHDQSGRYIDTTTASWSMITNPDARFSPEAAADLLSKDFQATNGRVLYPSAQLLDGAPVPEPSTILLWLGIGGAGLVVGRTRRQAARRV